jgi:class 3 adenylate cyclase
MPRDADPSRATPAWLKQMAQTQEAIRKILGSEAMVQWAKQMAETQAALRNVLGSEAVSHWAKQMADTQEAFRNALGGQQFVQWARQFADTQEALRRALGGQEFAQWARQFADMQEALRKALGGQEFAQSIKQMADMQEALRKALGGQEVAQWVAQTADVQETLRRSLYQVTLPTGARPKSYATEPRSESAKPVEPNPEAAKPKSRMLARHANHLWLSSAEAQRLVRRIERDERQRVFVLAADIRKSSQAMIEALDPLEYASTITSFVERSRQAVLDQNGIFDKFTGDGFLAYWPFDARTHLRVRRGSFEVTKSILVSFAEETMQRLRRNSQSLPSEVGLAFGIDEGLVSFVTIARDLTIVGPPVVGAVRMVGGATAGQIIANVHVGEEMRDDVRAGRLPGIDLVSHDIRGKEYPFQMAFLVRHLEFSLPE